MDDFLDSVYFACTLVEKFMDSIYGTMDLLLDPTLK